MVTSVFHDYPWFLLQIRQADKDTLLHTSVCSSIRGSCRLYCPAPQKVITFAVRAAADGVSEDKAFLQCVAWRRGQGGQPWMGTTAGKGKPRTASKSAKEGVGGQGWGKGRKDSSWALGEYSALIAGFQPLELQSKKFLWFKHPCLYRLCYVSPRKLTYAFQTRPHWLIGVFLWTKNSHMSVRYFLVLFRFYRLRN